MRGNAYAISLVGAAFALIALGGGALAWLAPVPAAQLTPAQDNLIDLADTLVKVGLGFLAGLFGARAHRPGKGAPRDP